MKVIASSRYSTKNSLSIDTKHDGIRVVGRSHKNSKVWVENDPQKGRRVKRNVPPPKNGLRNFPFSSSSSTSYSSLAIAN